MFAKGREAMRLTPAEVRLILIESLQWCANNAVYFLGLIGAATYDLAGTAFLVAAITLVRNLMTSVGNMVSGSVIDRLTAPDVICDVRDYGSAIAWRGVGTVGLVPGLVFWPRASWGLAAALSIPARMRFRDTWSRPPRAVPA